MQQFRINLKQVLSGEVLSPIQTEALGTGGDGG
jgi:hypothetical protein